MFEWLKELFSPSASPTLTQSLLAMSAAMALGIALGKIRFGKVTLGIAGVLFAGIFLGHFGYSVQAETLMFVRDAGLILFVYALGLQVGPAFFASFRSEGLRFIGLAATTVLLGAVTAIVIMKMTGLTIDHISGILAGAVTNTPSLGAAKATLDEISKQDPGKVFSNPANAYAIAYPVGALGVILIMLLLKRIFRIDIQKELDAYEAESQLKYPRPLTRKCRVTRTEAFGKTLREIDQEVGGHGVIFTRMKHSKSRAVETPSPLTQVQENDVLLIEGLPEELDRAIVLLGRLSTDEFILAEEHISARTFLVTRKEVCKQSLAQLNLEARYGLRVTRIARSGMEFLAEPSFILHYGDRVRVVGDRRSLEEIQKMMGNSEKRLLEPELLTIFVGIILGVTIGSIPFFIPGLSMPLKLGIAAGPLLAAVFISRYGGIGTLHSYLNLSAILFMKDFGLCLFFAAVGLSAGKTFVETFLHYGGWWWVLYGALVTLVPPLIMGLIGRYFFKINYLQLIGILGGSYTSPPSLAFSTTFTGSDIPAQAYATVFPVVTILRILVAQLLVLLFY